MALALLYKSIYVDSANGRRMDPVNRVATFYWDKKIHVYSLICADKHRYEIPEIKIFCIGYIKCQYQFAQR